MSNLETNYNLSQHQHEEMTSIFQGNGMTKKLPTINKNISLWEVNHQHVTSTRNALLLAGIVFIILTRFQSLELPLEVYSA